MTGIVFPPTNLGEALLLLSASAATGGVLGVLLLLVLAHTDTRLARWLDHRAWLRCVRRDPETYQYFYDQYFAGLSRARGLLVIQRTRPSSRWVRPTYWDSWKDVDEYQAQQENDRYFAALDRHLQDEERAARRRSGEPPARMYVLRPHRSRAEAGTPAVSTTDADPAE